MNAATGLLSFCSARSALVSWPGDVRPPGIYVELPATYTSIDTIPNSKGATPQNL